MLKEFCSWTLSAILNIGCKLESPEGLLKLLMPESHPPEILTSFVWAEAWPLGPFKKHQPHNLRLQTGVEAVQCRLLFRHFHYLKLKVFVGGPSLFGVTLNKRVERRNNHRCSQASISSALIGESVAFVAQAESIRELG